MHIGIINQGNLLFQGTLAELVSKRQQNSFIIFETNDDSATLQIINDFGVISRIESGKLRFRFSKKKQLPQSIRNWWKITSKFIKSARLKMT